MMTLVEPDQGPLKINDRKKQTEIYYPNMFLKTMNDTFHT